MKNNGNVLYRGNKGRRIGTVAPDDIHPSPRQPPEPCSVPDRASDPIALSKEQFSQVAAHETGPPGDQNPLGTHLLLVIAQKTTKFYGSVAKVPDIVKDYEVPARFFPACTGRLHA